MNSKIDQLEACKSNTWHTVHFIMTIIFIPWIVVWIGCAWVNNKHNKNIDAHIVMVHNETVENAREIEK